jgi:hypothetical protein
MRIKAFVLLLNRCPTGVVAGGAGSIVLNLEQ